MAMIDFHQRRQWRVINSGIVVLRADEGKRDLVPAVFAFGFRLILTGDSVRAGTRLAAATPDAADKNTVHQHQLTVLNFILERVAVFFLHALAQHHQHQSIASVNTLRPPVDDVLGQITQNDGLAAAFGVIDIEPVAGHFQHVLCHQLRLLINAGASAVGILQQIAQFFRRGESRILSECQSQQTYFRVACDGIKHGADEIVIIAPAVTHALVCGVEQRQVVIARRLYRFCTFAKIPDFLPDSASRPVFRTNPGDVVISHIRRWYP